jgi:cytochrome P450
VQTIAWWKRSIPLFERCRRRYGPRFTLRLLSTPPMVHLADPEDIKEMFTAPADVLHPGQGARILEPVVGRYSVILLDEAAHLEQRRLMLPAFHGERVQALSDLMAEVAKHELARWPRGEPVALHPRLQSLTLEIILRTVFGVAEGERLDALRESLAGILAFGASPVSMLPFARRPLGGLSPYARFAPLSERTDELLFELIDERRSADAEGQDVLALLLEARHEDGSPMTPRELRDELMTLLVAGHETTASELAWAFERLLREPAVLRRLTDEIDRGDDDAYLTATVQETLRRRPVLPNAAPRLVMRPLVIGPRTYPAGVALAANSYLVHHDPALYPDPYAFRPERFLEQPPGTYTWIPFGGGRRRCLGASFATLEMKIVLREVLAACEVRATSSGPELSRRRSITLSPRLGSPALLADRRQPVETGTHDERLPGRPTEALA